MEIDISGWHGVDRQEKKDAKRRAKHRKAQSVEEQQQVETSIGEEAGGKDAFIESLLQQMRAESREEQRQGETSTGEEAVLETDGKAIGAWRDVLEMFGGLMVTRQQKSAVTLWRMHRAEEKVEELEQEAARREHNKAMQSALQQSRHPAKFIALGGDEQRMALDGSFYTASEFCNFYEDKYPVDCFWFWEKGNGIEYDYMLDNARQEFAYLMNA